jgi:hypothetical protein
MGSSSTDGMGRQRASSQARLSASRNALHRARSSSPLSKNTHPLAHPPGGGSLRPVGFSSLLASPPPTARGLILSCAVSPNGVSYSCLSISRPAWSPRTPGGFFIGGMGPPLGAMLPWSAASLQPQHLTPKARSARGQLGRGLMDADHGEVRREASLVIVKDQPEHQTGHIREADAERPHPKP